jgi:hypothetical protein
MNIVIGQAGKPGSEKIPPESRTPRIGPRSIFDSSWLSRLPGAWHGDPVSVSSAIIRSAKFTGGDILVGRSLGIFCATFRKLLTAHIRGCEALYPAAALVPHPRRAAPESASSCPWGPSRPGDYISIFVHNARPAIRGSPAPLRGGSAYLFPPSKYPGSARASARRPSASAGPRAMPSRLSQPRFARATSRPPPLPQKSILVFHAMLAAPQRSRGARQDGWGPPGTRRAVLGVAALLGVIGAAAASPQASVPGEASRRETAAFT